MSVKNKVALVTGAASGIGKRIAEVLADNGAHIAIADINQSAAQAAADEIKARGVKATAIVMDVTDEKAVDGGVEKTVRDLGSVDILVSNAGIASRGHPVAETEPAEMERHFGIHVMGAFHLAHLLVPQMRDRPRGDVVMVSSVNATANPARGAPYNVAKAALESLAFTLAREEVRHGIHVNVVSPGLVVSEMGRRLVKAAGVEDIHSLDDAAPFGHVCEPADVARVVRFLVSDDAGYVTGQRLAVDGGGPRR